MVAVSISPKGEKICNAPQGVGEAHGTPDVKDSRICVKFPTTFCRHSKERKFYTLHDDLCRIDILEEAWKNVAANHGTAGIDGQTIDSIKAYETDIFLKNLRQELVS